MASALLSNSLTHVDALIGSCGRSRAFALALMGDPYRIDLPAYGGAGGALVTPEAMRILASLYFMAELEGTFLLSVAEELASARFTLDISDREAARLIEQLATAMRGDWIDRDLRNQIFVRVFGLGFTDPGLGQTIANHEFEPRFAMFCGAIGRLDDEARFGRPSFGAGARLTMAARTLIANLGGRLLGSTLIVAEKMSAQLRLAIAALDHRGLTTLFRGRTAWDVIRAVLGADTPDLGTRVARAQNGMRLLSWSAGRLEALQSDAAAAAVLASPEAVAWADAWLRAVGDAPRQSAGGGYGAEPQRRSGHGNAPVGGSGARARSFAAGGFGGAPA